LSVETLQRLTGHVDFTWLNPEVSELLLEAQSKEPGPEPIDRLIAPAFRSIKDFQDCGAVVLRVSGPDNSLWRRVEKPLADEVTERIHVEIDALHMVIVDPRSPTLWRADDFDLIDGRNRAGTGMQDRIAEVATASIKLLEFTSRPRIPERYITAALRKFVLTGK